MLALLVVSVPAAIAMGQAPSTCPNRYDGAITAMQVTYPGGTLNPIANPGSSFTLPVDSSYNVTLTIHTNSQSSAANTSPGTTWFESDYPAYGIGACINHQGGMGAVSPTDIGPNDNVSVSLTVTNPHQNHEFQQGMVFWSTFGGPNVSYNVTWTTATSSSSSVEVDSLDANGNVITGYYTELVSYSSGSTLATGFTPSAFSTTVGQTYMISASDYGSCSFSHWSDGVTDNPRVFTASANPNGFTAVYDC